MQDTNLLALNCSVRYATRGAILIDVADLMVSDSSWRCTSQEPAADWYTAHYDDNNWPSSVVVNDDELRVDSRFDITTPSLVITRR